LNYNEKLIDYNKNVTIDFIPYEVYNCSLIESVLPVKFQPLSDTGSNRKIERLLAKPFVPIYYDGIDRVFYSVLSGDVHLPESDSFTSLSAFYGTAMHKLAHATGHKTRLDRNQCG
jgi:antirestriction protein ArdC